MQLKIRGKLLTAFLAMLVPYVALVLISSYVLKTVRDADHFVLQVSEEKEFVSSLQLALDRALMPSNDYIITGKMEYREDFEASSREIDRLFNEAGKILGLEAATTEVIGEERRILNDVKSHWVSIKEISMKIFSIPDAAGSVEAAKLMEEMDYKHGSPAVDRLARWHEIDKGELEDARASAARAWRLAWIVRGAGVFALAGLAVIFAYLYSGVFVRPIRTLHEHAEKVANGDFKSRADISTGDEIEQCAVAMNSMSGKLDELYANLEDVVRERTRELNEALLSIRENEERMRQIIEQMPYPVQVESKDGTAIMVNKAFLEIFGISRADEYVGKYNVFNDPFVLDVLGLRHEMEKAFGGEVAFIPEKEIPLEHAEGRYGITKKGTDPVVEITAYPVFGGRGDIWGVMIIFKDITGRKKAEEALNERLNDLETFKRLTLKRELRLRELKDRVIELEKRLKAAAPSEPLGRGEGA